tara:strand:- start:22136 stop:22309 length:174 start_codon:yes stop_codon:yes gene_type:complete
MYQGGELLLHGDCGGFDFHPLHQNGILTGLVMVSEGGLHLSECGSIPHRSSINIYRN